MPYWASYSITFIGGVVMSYYLNRKFVFGSHRGWKSVILFPLVYVVQYFLGLLILWLWVDKAGLSEKTGPLVVIGITTLATYAMSHWIFVENHKKDVKTDNPDQG
jgi:putative flippase GtrA